MTSFSKLRMGLMTSAAITFALPAHATEDIDVTIASGFSPSVAVVKLLQQSFMPGVDRRLAETGNYHIDWREAFSGTLAKPSGLPKRSPGSGCGLAPRPAHASVGTRWPSGSRKS